MLEDPVGIVALRQKGWDAAWSVECLPSVLFVSLLLFQGRVLRSLTQCVADGDLELQITLPLPLKYWLVLQAYITMPNLCDAGT